MKDGLSGDMLASSRCIVLCNTRVNCLLNHLTLTSVVLGSNHAQGSIRYTNGRHNILAAQNNVRAQQWCYLHALLIFCIWIQSLLGNMFGQLSSVSGIAEVQLNKSIDKTVKWSVQHIKGLCCIDRVLM